MYRICKHVKPPVTTRRRFQCHSSFSKPPSILANTNPNQNTKKPVRSKVRSKSRQLGTICHHCIQVVRRSQTQWRPRQDRKMYEQEVEVQAHLPEVEYGRVVMQFYQAKNAILMQLQRWTHAFLLNSCNAFSVSWTNRNYIAKKQNFLKVMHLSPSLCSKHEGGAMKTAFQLVKDASKAKSLSALNKKEKNCYQFPTTFLLRILSLMQHVSSHFMH